MTRKSVLTGVVLMAIATAAFAADDRVRPLPLKPGQEAAMINIEQLGREEAIQSILEAEAAVKAGLLPAPQPARLTLASRFASRHWRPARWLPHR